MLGAVTDTSIRVWIRTSSAATVLVQYQPIGAGWGSPSETAAHVMASGDDFTNIFSVTGLAPDTVYDYRPKVDGTPDTGNASTFRTLPPAGVAAAFNFVVGADTHASSSSSVSPIYDTMAAHAPAFMVFLGDRFYNDAGLNPQHATTESGFWTAYKNAQDANMQAFGKLYPFFGTWDDHDYGLNDAGDTYPFKIPSRAAFGKYWPNPDYVETDAAVYYKFTAAHCEFFMLDCRWKHGTLGTTMVGAAQLAWLKASLLASTATFKFILSSVMVNDFATTPVADAWRGFVTERTDLFDYIKNNNIRNVIFLSGDQHWTGVFLMDHNVYQCGDNVRGFYDISATPMSPDFRPKTTSNNYQVLYKNDAAMYYGFIRVTIAEVVAEIRQGTAGTLVYSLSIPSYSEHKRTLTSGNFARR